MLAARAGILGVIWTIAFFTCALAPVSHAQSGATLQIAASADTQALLRQAEAELASGNAEFAYTRLSSHEAELAGNPMFDYLLGVAALDTGRNSEAIFALRRSIAVESRFSGARMELARAYFESGNRALARPLFVTLLAENPPPGVRDILNGYIRAIDTRPGAPRSHFMPYGEIAAGNDSNANGSTATQQFFGFTLSPQNVETESPFYELAAGFNWSIPSSSRQGWLLGARASHRSNPDASFVDATVINGLGAYQWRRGAFFGRAGADGYLVWRDGNANESYGGLDVLLGRSVSSSWDVSLGLRGGALRHDTAIEVLDVNRILYTLGATWRFAPLASLALEAIGGEDSERQSGSPYGNSKVGGRLSLTAPLGNHFFYASIGSLTSDFDGLFFGVPREDTQFNSIAQIEFRDVGVDGLSLIPRVRYIDNDSDLLLYKYDRTEISLILKWIPR
jgi:tetratricopeptide (TPR) repeat protein